MRWDGLFADLEAQADALELAERAAQVEERARIEIGQQRLLDRLRPALGTHLRLRAAGGLSIAGALRRVGQDWLLIDDGAGREAVLALAAVVEIGGLGRLTAVEPVSVVESRLGLRHALRAIARDRSPVRVHLRDSSTADGTLDRIGGDFVELAAHAAGELRRRGEVRDVLVVPLGAIVAVRRDAAVAG